MTFSVSATLGRFKRLVWHVTSSTQPTNARYLSPADHVLHVTAIGSCLNSLSCFSFRIHPNVSESGSFPVASCSKPIRVFRPSGSEPFLYQDLGLNLIGWTTKLTPARE